MGRPKKIIKKTPGRKPLGYERKALMVFLTVPVKNKVKRKCKELSKATGKYVSMVEWAADVIERAL